MQTLRQRIIGQGTSGRWLLTVAAAIAFVALVRAYIHGQPSISGDAIAAIISTVFTHYFLKKENGNSRDQNGNTPTN